MHPSERESLILMLLGQQGFVSFRELEKQVSGSPATIRRDLERLNAQGQLTRVRGGIKSVGKPSEPVGLSGVPFHENVSQNVEAKRAIGKAAAALCRPGEAVMIDGGSTTLQMCPHLDGLGLQILTNSLHIVSAILPQTGTRVLVPAGQIFREQNIILSAAGDDVMPSLHAPRLFMGAAAVGPKGLMQADVVLVASERRLIERADEIIVLVDSSKFDGPSGNVVCGLEDIDTIITDDRVSEPTVQMLKSAGVGLVVAPRG